MNPGPPKHELVVCGLRGFPLAELTMLSSIRSNYKVIAGAAAAATGAAAGLSAAPAKNAGTADAINGLAARVSAIENDLGMETGISMDNYPRLKSSNKSLCYKCLTPEIYAKYKDVKTENGFSFDSAIQPACDAPHLGVGMVAGDEDSYACFKDMYDAIIEGWHNYKPDQLHKLDIDFNNLNMSAEQVVSFDKHVISTRIRAGRSIRGFPLPPHTNRVQRRQVEGIIAGALKQMEGDLKGTYYALNDMTADQENQLIDDHFLFQKPSARNVLGVCGAARDWPDGRGIFHNDEKTFLVWVNEEDHMRCISMQAGGNVKEVFARWARAIQAVGVSVKADGYDYMYNDHLGNICCCPSNLGTGLRASVMLKLPKLYAKLGVTELEALTMTFDLQARGGKGEHSPPGPGASFDISNIQRIGFSEVELIQKMIDGCDKLIKMEEAL